MLYLKQVVVLETVVVHWLACGMIKTTASASSPLNRTESKEMSE